jgi:hypothetical protein
MKFKQVLKEEFYDTFKYKPSYSNDPKLVEVWKNPNSNELREILKKQSITIARGVLFKSGDLYIASGKNVIHEDLLKILSKDGLLDFNKFWDEDIKHLDKYLCVYTGRDKIIRPADSYQEEPFEIIKEKYLDVYEKSLSKKNRMFRLKAE